VNRAPTQRGATRPAYGTDNARQGLSITWRGREIFLGRSEMLDDVLRDDYATGRKTRGKS